MSLYLEYNRSLALLLRDHLRVHELLGTASSVIGGRSHWFALLNIDALGSTFVSSCCGLVSRLDQGQFGRALLAPPMDSL